MNYTEPIIKTDVSAAENATREAVVYPAKQDTWALPETLTDAAMRELRAAVAELTRRAVTAEAREAATCEWTEDRADGSWDGACGERWYLVDGTPSANGMNYCPKCGKHLVPVVTPEPVEDD